MLSQNLSIALYRKKNGSTVPFLCFLVFVCFVTGSNIITRMVLNQEVPCVSLSSASIIGMHHHDALLFFMTHWDFVPSVTETPGCLCISSPQTFKV